MQTPLRTKKHGVPKSFNQVAHRYDLLSSLNPGYKRHLVRSARRLELSSNSRILDLCCGTGLSTAAIHTAYPRASVVALDASEGMLEAAKSKPALRDVELVLGDASDPAAAGVVGPFDGILMAYGIRNVPEPDRCLGNLLELLKPGAPIAFHEYSVADSRYSRVVWKAVAGAVIIPLGRLLSGSDEIFRYLRQSVLDFDGREAFVGRLGRAGFDSIEVLPMGGWQRGIVHTFLARRPR